MGKLYPILSLALAVGAMTACKPQENMKELVSKLNQEQKVLLMIGTGMELADGNVGKTKLKVPGCAGTSYAIEEHAIPAIVFADGPAGVRIDPTRENEPGKTFYATAFPVGSLLASTWDPEVAKTVGNSFGDECNAYGVDILLAPGMNIQRNPLCGRNFEYYSEDPLLSGKISSGFTQGVQAMNVGVSIKHFVANNSETNRMDVNENISERAMREIYLKGFEIAVKEGKPWTVMSSYNLLNGTYTSERKDLLETILRNEWGFDGLVMSDWYGGKDAVAQINAGNDLLMPGTSDQQDSLISALKSGRLSKETADRNLERMLGIYRKTGSWNGRVTTNIPNSTNNANVSKTAATEGMILLKNNNKVLPIASTEGNIALFGLGSYETIKGGTGSGDVHASKVIHIFEGLENAGFSLDQDLKEMNLKYNKQQHDLIPEKKGWWLPDSLIDDMQLSEEEISAISKRTTLAIYTISRTSGEFYDRKEKNDFQLKAGELELLKLLSKVYHAQNKALVVLLNIGGVIETASWKELADAILLTWQPGQEAGNAVADMLSGKANPSGKLTMTFPVNYADAYSSRNFPGKAMGKIRYLFGSLPSQETEVDYQEDIYVGYRYFETAKIPVSFPFGFGLSYTSFSYEMISADKKSDGNVQVKFKIKNTGSVAGKEVAELYVQSPKGKLSKPALELKAFQKTILLKPGEEQTIDLTVTPYQLSSFDEETHSWILEKGDYVIQVGSSLHELPLNATITNEETKVTLKTTPSLIPTANIQKLQF